MKYIKSSGKTIKNIMVSDKDFELLSRTKWNINSSGYATNGKIYMHQIVLPRIYGIEIDHKDGNKLNNTKENLRYATRSQQTANSSKKKNSKFRFKGVSKKNDRFRNKPWKVTITKNGVKYNLGYFKTEKEGAIAYNKKSLELFEEFAKVNII